MKNDLAIVLGLALLAPACGAARMHAGQGVARAPVRSAFDEGYARGWSDGSWAAHRDRGKPYRKSFWDDGRYRAATNGYRTHYGSKFEYSEGFRAGYERAYWERHGFGRY
jgi:hypothetical protein